MSAPVVQKGHKGLMEEGKRGEEKSKEKKKNERKGERKKKCKVELREN